MVDADDFGSSKSYSDVQMGWFANMKRPISFKSPMTVQRGWSKCRRSK
jgi:hypothetical protein